MWRLPLDIAAWAFVRGTSALGKWGSAQRRAWRGSVECCGSIQRRSERLQKVNDI